MRLRQLVQARRRRLGGTSVEERDPKDNHTGAEIAPGVCMLQTEYASGQLLPEPPSRLPGDSIPAGTDAPLAVFDTETTGLGNGAGQWVWMVGILIYQQQIWTLRQWWLSRPGAECLFLDAIAAGLPEDAVLISYNGRSFDLPMLRTRHQLNGLVNPFADRPHLDLLLLVRRRYRGCWPNCRLATVERELLGRPREDDLPGSMAPAAWRDYLRFGSTQGIAQVLKHNRLDLESLVFLTKQLARGGPDDQAYKSA